MDDGGAEGRGEREKRGSDLNDEIDDIVKRKRTGGKIPTYKSAPAHLIFASV